MVACTAGSSSTIRILATASPVNTIFGSMSGCETVVLCAQAFPQKSARRVVEKAGIAEPSMHDIGQTLSGLLRQRMIRLAFVGCKEIAGRRDSKSCDD